MLIEEKEVGVLVHLSESLMHVIDKSNTYNIDRVQSNMQQILFSAENTVQGVFLCILTLATISENPATHRLKCQNSQREFIA